MTTDARKIELLKSLPKIEMHIHLEGSIQPGTALELAKKNNIALPPCNSPEELYSYDTLDVFLGVYNAIAKSVVDVDDFRRITYEMLQAASGNGARYMEFFISPQAHEGVAFSTQFEGIRQGMKDAQTDFGITSAIIPGTNRELGPENAAEYLDLILENRQDDIIGLGLDYFEAPFPPEPFADTWARAAREGLRLTAHAGEAGPPQFIEASIDVLKVERIDHGYSIMQDPALVQRCKDMGIMFTCCPATSTYTTEHRDLSAPDHPIRLMNEAGLVVSVHTDDPPMFLTDLGQEYVNAVDKLGFSPQDIRRSILATIDHAWVDDSTKKSWRDEWTPEIDRITSELEKL